MDKRYWKTTELMATETKWMASMTVLNMLTVDSNFSRHSSPSYVSDARLCRLKRQKITPW
jgi:hypothetical protein